jgi:hypothetical protein
MCPGLHVAPTLPPSLTSDNDAGRSRQNSFTNGDHDEIYLCVKNADTNLCGYSTRRHVSHSLHLASFRSLHIHNVNSLFLYVSYIVGCETLPEES